MLTLNSSEANVLTSHAEGSYCDQLKISLRFSAWCFHCDDDLLFKSSSFGDTFCKKRSAFPSSCLVSSYLIDWSKEILGKWRWAYNDSCHNQDGLFALFTPGSWEIRRDDTSFLPSSPLFLYNYVARKNIRKEKGKRDICEKISLKSSTFRMKLIWWSLFLKKKWWNWN